LWIADERNRAHHEEHEDHEGDKASYRPLFVLFVSFVVRIMGWEEDANHKSMPHREEPEMRQERREVGRSLLFLQDRRLSLTIY
jgi:hypothetical protein